MSSEAQLAPRLADKARRWSMGALWPALEGEQLLPMAGGQVGAEELLLTYPRYYLRQDVHLARSPRELLSRGKEGIPPQRHQGAVPPLTLLLSPPPLVLLALQFLAKARATLLSV